MSNQNARNQSRDNFLKSPLSVVALIIVLFLLFKLSEMSNPTKNRPALYNLRPYELLQDYKDNEAAADKKYLNKVISVTGIVTNISSEDIRLNEDVVCNFEGNDKDKLANIRKGESITIKGECTGKFLWTVHLNNCTIL